MAFNSAIEHLTRHASLAQVQRACYATFTMFVSWDSYAVWRFTGTYPPAWEYLAARQHDSFYTSMTLIDAVGGYELDANLVLRAAGPTRPDAGRHRLGDGQ